MCVFLFFSFFFSSVDVCISGIYMSEGGVGVGVWGCDKTLKAFWNMFCDTPEVSVTADTPWPSVLPMLHKVLETGLFRPDLFFI